LELLTAYLLHQRQLSTLELCPICNVLLTRAMFDEFIEVNDPHAAGRPHRVLLRPGVPDDLVVDAHCPFDRLRAAVVCCSRVRLRIGPYAYYARDNAIR
jgi:hypothetical protein